MYGDQLPYRQLYDGWMAYEGGAGYDDLLRPWLAANEGERRWLDAVRARPGRPIPPMTPEERCRLYALSRIVDLLQLSFAPAGEQRTWDVAPVTRDEYARFMDALGLQVVDRVDFHPFHHEIVAVDEVPDEGALPEVVQVFWLGYMLGPLLITRAGVRVAAGRRHLRREVAERSTLYWAHARNTRPTTDLGSGWGGNSQWRTPFRRDYLLAGTLHYNVDAAPPSAGGRINDDLDAAERAELLRHRCFVICPKPDDDRWPYDLTMTEQA
ncbi:MAG TPA: hypothetical protein VE871_14665 [Longimicrobium sp.]|nr:hypothetical protein [Longimicrobium sp.]